MKKNLFVLAVMTIAFVGCKKEEAGSEKWPSTSIPTDEIHYTSSDGEIIEPKNSKYFGEDVTIVNNTYENGKGIIKFSAPVTTIGDSVFDYSSRLTSIIIPNSVTSIEYRAIDYCDNLTSVFIPNSVTSIGDMAFCGCYNLTNVTIPNCVTTIGEHAFGSCASLTSITIPNSVTSIGDAAFCNGFSLTAIYGKFASADNRCLIVDGTLISFALACGVTEYTIPYGVISIRPLAFQFCKSLTNVTIPDSVKTIGHNAFAACTSLTTVDIPDSVTSIENNAFNISNGNLTNVYCRATTPPALGASVFYTNNRPESLQAIYVPKESVEAYKSAENWSEYIDLVQGYDF